MLQNERLKALVTAIPMLPKSKETGKSRPYPISDLASGQKGTAVTERLLQNDLGLSPISDSAGSGSSIADGSKPGPTNLILAAMQ